ncbi:MAG: hypothetical protein KTR31_07950 [Myxococcales bacterium]|nr:hypothetical protein [Myxococcales bacterium]
MKHLRRDRLVPHPSPPRTDDEHVHLAGCVECRVRALLLASHLTEHAPQSPIAGPSMERVRRTITRWVQASGTPELRGGQFGTVEQAPDGLVWRHAALQASPQDLERAERIDALALPGVVPWQLQGRDVVSDWLPGTTLDEWRSTAELGDTVTTLRVLQDVAHTLSRLHQAGLSHGGIAADRVLVCQGRGFLLLAGLSSAEGPTEVHAFGELCHEQLPPTTTALLPPPGTPLHELGPALTTVGLDEAWHTATHAPDALEPNTVVDRFRVVGERGRGAMAVVYEVQHRLLGTRHAMKVVLGRSVMVRRRLVREGRLQARLGHPNLVPVTDLIDVFGEPALILPLIDGPSLAEALEHSTPDRIEALALFAGVVAGVSYAHDNGVVRRGPGHRLRPRQGLARRDGRPVDENGHPPRHPRLRRSRAAVGRCIRGPTGRPVGTGLPALRALDGNPPLHRTRRLQRAAGCGHADLSGSGPPRRARNGARAAPARSGSPHLLADDPHHARRHGPLTAQPWAFGPIGASSRPSTELMVAIRPIFSKKP